MHKATGAPRRSHTFVSPRIHYEEYKEDAGCRYSLTLSFLEGYYVAVYLPSFTLNEQNITSKYESTSGLFLTALNLSRLNQICSIYMIPKQWKYSNNISREPRLLILYSWSLLIEILKILQKIKLEKICNNLPGGTNKISSKINCQN